MHNHTLKKLCSAHIQNKLVAQIKQPTKREMFPPICFHKSKACVKYLLALSLVFWSLWLVWDLCLKFLRGSTTTVHEQEQRGYLALPHFLLCNKQRYKTDELADMELPEDFFDNWTDRTKFRHNDSFPDLNATWNRATWSRDDIGIDYRRYEGEVTNI